MPRIRHTLNTLLDNRLATQIVSDDDTIDLEKILPVPAGLSTRDANTWKNENWGTTEPIIPAETTESSITFETGTPNMRALLCALSKLVPDVEIHYCYASELLGENLGCFSYFGGACTEMRKITDEELFACSVWQVDYYAMLELKALDKMNAVPVDMVSRYADSLDSESSEYSELDNILSEGDF